MPMRLSVFSPRLFSSQLSTLPARLLSSSVFSFVVGAGMALSCAQAAPSGPVLASAADDAKGQDKPRDEATPQDVAKAGGPGRMVIRVLLSVKADQREAFERFLDEEAKTVRKMDGCERYQLFASTSEEGAYLLYEEWASAEAFEAFQKSDTLKKSFAVLGPMLAGKPDSAYFKAQKVN